MNDILGAIRAEYKRRDILLSIKTKLNKHYIISSSFWIFVYLAGGLLVYLILQSLSDKPINGAIPILIFLITIMIIPSVTKHPTYILDNKELNFMQKYYDSYLYDENGKEYIKGIFRDTIQHKLDIINKRVGSLREKNFYGWLNCELYEYIQILDRITKIKSNKKLTKKLLNFLNKQVAESCPLDGILISSYPIAIFDIYDLTFIKSDPYLYERFKSALINNKMNVNESFKNDVTSYLSKFDNEITFVTEEAFEFRKRIDQQKQLDFVNAM